MLTRAPHRIALFWLLCAVFSLAALTGIAAAQEAETTPEATESSVVAEGFAAAEGMVEAAAGAAGDLWAQVTQTPRSDVARLLLIVGGIILLVAGWFIYEWIILIAGFMIGASVALATFSDTNAILQIVVFLIGGLFGAVLGGLLYYVAVFLIGGYIGLALTQALAAALSLLPVSLIAAIIGFLIGGFVLVVLSLELLIFFSAIVGAQMIALALNLGLPWMLMLALVGMVLQLVAVRARGDSIRRRPARRAPWRRRAVVD
jgi:hypothetical protein